LQESRSISHGKTRKRQKQRHEKEEQAEALATELHGRKNKQKQKISDGNKHPLGARLKGSNGVVAVGLPHRNYSVFKQTHINQWEVKSKRRGASTSGLTSAAQ
jgi:hypothetical protein